MAYVPTTFVDRSVEFPNRRKLTAVSGQADTFDVARAEGTVFAEGTKPDAANLNAEFEKIKAETDAINTSLTAPTAGMFIYDYQDGKYGYNTDPSRGADTFFPFSAGTFEALEEGFIPLQAIEAGSSVYSTVNFKNTYAETPVIIAFLSDMGQCSYEASVANSYFVFRLINNNESQPRSSSVRWYAVTGDVYNKIFSDS